MITRTYSLLGQSILCVMDQNSYWIYYYFYFIYFYLIFKFFCLLNHFHLLVSEYNYCVLCLRYSCQSAYQIPYIAQRLLSACLLI